VIPRSFRKPLSLPTSSRDAGANQTRGLEKETDAVNQ
jgi:hypothetical protein